MWYFPVIYALALGKVEDHEYVPRALDDPPVGEFPGVGDDRHKFCGNSRKRSGILASRGTHEIPLQSEVHLLPPRLRRIGIGQHSSLVSTAILGDLDVGALLQTLSVAATMREGAVPGYKPIESSVGLLLSGMEARIIREDGTDGGVGEPGELWIRGGSIFLGYLNDEEATAKAFADGGWFKTGDIFTVDEKQNF